MNIKVALKNLYNYGENHQAIKHNDANIELLSHPMIGRIFIVEKDGKFYQRKSISSVMSIIGA